jgi:Skp family chaperone for outer membrane proteins
MTIKKLLIASALASAAVTFAAPAQAQVSGIATVSQMRAIVQSKAFAGANTAIATTYKTAFDQINARRTAEQQELTPLLTTLDTNHDQQFSQAEIDAAKAAKNPAIAKIQTAQENADKDVARMQQPIVLAQAYAAELILQQYEGAQNRVVQAKKVSMILSPEAFIYAPDGVDITPAVTAELDKVLPSVPVTPPANWQPQEGTMMFLQQYGQLIEQARQRAGQQGGAPAPAAAAPRPAGAAPARPATPTPAPQSR